MKKLFSPKDVAQLVGISYRQIQYWDSSGFIRPSKRKRGRFRYYTFGDLILLKVAKELREQGVSIQRLRTIIQSLSRLVAKKKDTLEDLTFLMEDESILVFTGDVVMDQKSARNFYQFRVPALRAEVEAMFLDQDDEDDQGQSEAV